MGNSDYMKIGKIVYLFYHDSGQILEQIAQEGGGIPIPGGVQD